MAKMYRHSTEETPQFSQISETGISGVSSKYTHLKEDYLCSKHSRLITLKRKKNNTKCMSCSAWCSNTEHRTILSLSLLFISSSLDPGRESRGCSSIFLRAFLQWQVVTGMAAEQMIESLANYIWFLRVPNAVYISHLLLIDRRTPVDLWCHKFDSLPDVINLHLQFPRLWLLF